jgi:hypothetical protein
MDAKLICQTVGVALRSEDNWKLFSPNSDSPHPSRADPPVIWFWKWIEWKDYKVQKKSQLGERFCQKWNSFLTPPTHTHPHVPAMGSPTSIGPARSPDRCRTSAHPRVPHVMLLVSDPRHESASWPLIILVIMSNTICGILWLIKMCAGFKWMKIMVLTRGRPPTPSQCFHLESPYYKGGAN